MVGHEDPEGDIIRAEDGFLAVKVREKTPDPQQQKADPKVADEKDWMQLDKKDLDEFAKEMGIELDRRKSLKFMQKKFAEALAEKE